MSNEVRKFRSELGGSVLVEVGEAVTPGVADGGQPATRRGRPAAAVEEAGESIERVLGKLGPAVKGVVSQLRATADWPDEVEIEFAVKISADSNVIIARAGGEANFRVALKWSHEHASNGGHQPEREFQRPPPGPAPPGVREVDWSHGAREVLRLEHPKHGMLGLGARQISEVAFSPDGTQIATASRDDTARVWVPAHIG